MRWLLMVLAGLLCTLTPVQAEDLTTEHKILTAPKVTAPLVIDGQLNDWPTAMAKGEMALDPDDEMDRASARIAWDAQFLYVAFEVVSGKGMRNAGDNPAIAFKTGDTVEVFLSVNADPLAERVPRSRDLDEAKAGDYKVLLTMLRNRKPTVFGYDFVHAGAAGTPLVLKMSGAGTQVDCSGLIPDAVMVARDAQLHGTAGYIVEAKLPWAYFRNYHPVVGARLLCNLAVNYSNDAGTGNMGKAYWNGPSYMVTDLGIEAQIHPQYWGWLSLADTGDTKK